MSRAFITGIGGQDGVLLAELLLENGYEVFGTVRDPDDPRGPGLVRLGERVTVVRADLLDQVELQRVLTEVAPTELYNLAAPSFVPRSWEQPVATAEFAAVGATSLLEAVRATDPTIRVYQASSSEIFGTPAETPQTEATALRPLTPYGVAKAYAHFIAGSYRHQYGIFASCGILYNHESPLRPAHFLPRKVSSAVAAIVRGRQQELVLGDLAARRDWGYAGDYVRSMWLMLQADEPGDFVIASGELHSVEELVAEAFAVVDLDWRDYVRVDPALVRGRAELRDLVGDTTRARTVLGWQPEVGFSELVGMLVRADLAALAQEPASE